VGCRKEISNTFTEKAGEGQESGIQIQRDGPGKGEGRRGEIECSEVSNKAKKMPTIMETDLNKILDYWKEGKS